MNRQRVTGIVLAGGNSSRMGFDKGLAHFRGKPLVQYAIETLEQICSRIIISTNSVSYGHLGYPVKGDIFPGTGPMGAIYSALMSSKTEHNLVLSCDTPFVTSLLMHRLLKNAEGFQVVLPESKPGFVEPLIGYYHINNTTAMLAFIQRGDLKLIDYIETSYYRCISMYGNPEQFLNINTPDDFEKFAQK